MLLTIQLWGNFREIQTLSLPTFLKCALFGACHSCAKDNLCIHIS